MIRNLPKTALLLGLIGSVSILALTASAQESSLPPMAEPALIEPAQPSFSDIVSPPPAQESATLPEPEPAAPVIIDAADLTLPRRSRFRCPTAPPRSLPSRRIGRGSPSRTGWRDPAAIRELRLTKADGDALSAFYAASEQPLIWVRRRGLDASRESGRGPPQSA